MRLFFAIWPPKEIRARLWESLAPWREIAPQVRWIGPERFHVTLRFVGDVPNALVPRLAAAADALTSESAFPARLKGTGTFPPQGIPRIFWVGVSADPLRRLRTRLDATLARIDLPDRGGRFSPHLTVGRAGRNRRRSQSAKSRELSQIAVSRIPRINFDFTVSAVHLVRSQLRATGPIYTNIHNARLSGQPRGKQ